MAKLGSRATANTVFPGQFNVHEGTFEAELLGMQIYWNDGFARPGQEAQDELQVSFIMGIDDPDATHEPDEDTGLFIHRENFVRLQVDEEGAFSPGGAKAKAYKLISAFFGQDFDAYSDEFEWSLESRAFDGYDSIADIPHRKSYKQGDEWLKLDAVTVMGESILGRKAMVQFGNAQKPDGTYSDRVTVVAAMAMPRKRGGSRGAPAQKSEAPADRPSRPAAKADGNADAPAHIKWVLSRLEKAGLNGETLPFLAHFAERPLESVLDLTITEAKTFKGLWESDEDQVKAMIADFLTAQAEADDDEFAEDDEDDNEFEEVEPAPAKAAAKAAAKAPAKARGGKLAKLDADAQRQRDLDNEFPPEEDLPF